ncbi:MAG: YlmC/YmxH family sporulation protein [Oscillospiraceae bacterium]|nr:YlmC/YmxH family sporulation protein [Oscillospiraceae bacterium]
MLNRLQELRCKEVINISDGARLGCVNDVVLDVVTGRVVSLVVPGPCRKFGLFGREEDYLIPWNCIKRIGDDIVLVDIIADQVLSPRPKKGFF